jgi:hypothetical protein
MRESILFKDRWISGKIDERPGQELGLTGKKYEHEMMREKRH